MRERFVLSGLLLLFLAFLILSNARETPSAAARAKNAAAETEVSADAAAINDTAASGVSDTAANTAALSDTAALPDAAASAQMSAPADSNAKAETVFLIPSSPPPAARDNARDAMNLVRLNDIMFEPGTKYEEIVPVRHNTMDFTYLMQNIFLAQDEPGLRTGVLPADVDADKLRGKDMKIRTGGAGAKILIMHTHSGEFYADSASGDVMEGVVGAGRHLAETLTHKYGVETLHHTGRYDIVDGGSQISGAYERMEPDIRRVLADNPSVEMLIDLHRDGLAPGTAPMVAVAGGKRAAKVMFVNGMCAENVNGAVVPVPWLQNPYIAENLALSFQAQLAANEMFPGFTRRIYLKPYRYSLHMLPKSLIVEVGAQNNTKREAWNAVEALAGVIAKVVGGQ